MASFMGIYKSCKCLPDESTGGSSDGTSTEGSAAKSTDGSSDGTSTDTSPASNTPGLRGFSESMYFSMTTQTTVGCAGSQHAHAWRVARAIARARCAFLENTRWRRYGDITVDKDKPWCIVAVSTQARARPHRATPERHRRRAAVTAHVCSRADVVGEIDSARSDRRQVERLRERRSAE